MPPYNKLEVSSITKERHDMTCGYWYLVTNGCTPHTAFKTRQGLDKWMQERGLKLEGGLPEKIGVFGTSRIVGEYEKEMHMSYDEFYSIDPVIITRDLCNGQWTLALITENKSGVRCVHTLNPNKKYRKVFDYQESSWLFN